MYLFEEADSMCITIVLAIRFMQWGGRRPGMSGLALFGYLVHIAVLVVVVCWNVSGFALFGCLALLTVLVVVG